MSDSDAPVPPRATSRRRVASALAAAAGAPLLARSLPLAAPSAPASAGTPGPTPSPTPAPPPPALEPTMQLVKAKFGQYLTPEQTEGVKQSVQRSILNAERMAKTPLANSDEPDVVFFAALPGVAGTR
jgi:hypothetical protein